MCGRYSFAPKPKQLQSLESSVVLPEVLQRSFNIAPTQLAYVIASNLPRQLQLMEWGLVPHWSSDGKNSGKRINARAEGIAEKPSFREPIHAKRCLVPADSFYEWRKSGGRKIPYRILLENDALLFMAGIWDEWQQAGKTKRTFSIITTTPNHEMADVHDRMPVILSDAAAQKRWLSDDLPLNEALALLHPLQDGQLSLYRVSEKLNKPGYNAEDLHTPLPDELTLF